MTTKRIKDVNGWFEVRDNPISRVGVFEYSGRAIGEPDLDPGRMYKVYRPAEELSDPETLASFRLLPFINEHPVDMLALDNEDLPTVDGKPAEGVIGEQVYFADGFLRGNLKIFTDRVAKAIEAGKREVSAGFRCMYERASGVFEGQPYDFIQRKIRGNHLALVHAGRMGPEVAVLDHLFKMTFDAKELIKMADKDTPPAGAKDAEGDMTLAELTALVKQIGPQIAALTEAMALLSKPAATDPALDTDPNANPNPEPTMDAETKTALDAMEKRLKALEGKPAPTFDAKEIAVSLHARDTLYKGVSAVVGAFDHSEMDAQGIAKYGVEKLGLKNVPAGAEIVAVEAYLAAKPTATAKAMDSKTNGAPSAIRQHVEANA
jgi:hypothetical protein